MNVMERIKLSWQILTARTPSAAMNHADRELGDPTDEMDVAMKRDIKQMLHVFSSQGHSGFSAAWATSLLVPLIKFEPIRPLTGDPSEWVEVGDGVFQNNRCGRVFKNENLFNGQAYDMEGRVFREPSGACYTSRDSFTPIEFPYTPSTVYVDVTPSPLALPRRDL